MDLAFLQFSRKVDFLCSINILKMLHVFTIVFPTKYTPNKFEAKSR